MMLFIRRCARPLRMLLATLADGTQSYFFTHFWGKGKATDLAHGFRAALDAQTTVEEH